MSARVSIRAVQDAVAREFGISIEEMTGPRCVAKLVQARHVAMFLTSRITQSSLAKIGRAFGGRDHSTVAHACGRIQRMATDDPDFAQRLVELSGALTLSYEEQLRHAEAEETAVQAINDAVGALRAGLIQAARRDPLAVMQHLAAILESAP